MKSYKKKKKLLTYDEIKNETLAVGKKIKGILEDKINKTKNNNLTPQNNYNIDNIARGTKPVEIAISEAPAPQTTDELVAINQGNNIIVPPAEISQPKSQQEIFLEQKNRLEKEQSQIENEILGLSESKYAFSAEQRNDQRRLQEMKGKLSGIKDQLYTLQDKKITIPQNQRGVFSDADVTVTSRQLNDAVEPQLLRNDEKLLATSRTYSRLGEAVGNYSQAVAMNQKIIDNIFNSKVKQLEFKQKQKNDLLDGINTQLGHILDSKSKIKLEERKHQNNIDEIKLKESYAVIRENAKTLNNSGADSGLVSDYINNDDPDARTKLAQKAYLNGQLSTKDFLNIQRSNANDKFTKEKQKLEERKNNFSKIETLKRDKEKAEIRKEELRLKNKKSTVAILTSDDLLKSVNLLLNEEKKGNLDNVLGTLDQFNIFHTFSDENKAMIGALDHIFSQETIKALADMKGSPSDKDMEVVALAAQRGFDRANGNPEILVDILKTMKERLENSKLVEKKEMDINFDLINGAEKQNKNFKKELTKIENAFSSNNIDTVEQKISTGTKTGAIPRQDILKHNQEADKNKNNYIRAVNFDDENINKILDGLADNESKGNGGYKAIGLTVVNNRSYKNERALGRYQVMPGNLKEWGRIAGYNNLTSEQFLSNPEIQDRVVGEQIKRNIEKYGSVKDAVSVHFSGQPYKVAKNRVDGNGFSVTQYVDKFVKNNNIA